ncbi:HNH endonuclease [Rhodovulum imhoffii]|uniref:HNH endonuclease n=1 Tax=Rhodovulum imhoffii TaxID=365340 RepID=A0A2T5BWD1_9RHOB|nr:HNH endonuclease [Rhodovulum imhoffii]MBK5935094.1 hypothetical protein [Rhodovulum imhoffii]PTN03941.1 HNH endonuclease [Rhodovulum imhoffii]
MNLCILCQVTAPDPRKPEHILLNALGGRLTTTKALCATCNNIMGAGPDKDLADSVAPLRNIANFRSGSGKAPPSIPRVEADGIVYDLAPGGKPVLRPSSPLFIEDGHEGVNVKISARDEAHLEQLLRGAAGKLGLPESAHDAFIKDAKQRATRVTGFAPRAEHGIQFGSEGSQRSMMKACLVLWNELVGNEELSHPRYTTSREFVRSGTDIEEDSHTPLTCIHTRKLLELPNGYGANPNYIWVGSDATGKVLGYFRLYNAVGWLFELASDGAPVSRSISLISNPFQPSEHRLLTDDNSLVDFRVFEAIGAADTKSNFDETRQALSELLRQAHSMSWDRTTKELFDEAIDATGLQDGDILDEQRLKDISSAIAYRFSHFLTRTPRTEPLEWPAKNSSNEGNAE